jgi:hypothetical protein
LLVGSLLVDNRADFAGFAGFLAKRFAASRRAVCLTRAIAMPKLDVFAF